jgi:hypothetical protein
MQKAIFCVAIAVAACLFAAEGNAQGKTKKQKGAAKFDPSQCERLVRRKYPRLARREERGTYINRCVDTGGKDY